MSFLPRLKKSIKTRLLVEAVFFLMPNTRGRMNNVFKREMGKPNAFPQKEKGNSKAVSQEGNG